MKKLLKIITGVTLSLAMAIGVGIGVANDREAKEVSAYTSLTEFELVTSTSQLVAGANYILGATYSNNNYFVNRTSNGNNRQLTTASISNNKVTLGNSIMPLTLGGSAGAWTFHTNDYAGTAGYFNATNTTSNNYLKIIADLDDYAYFSIAISNNNATITCTGKSSRNVIYLYQSNQISCYSSQTGSNYTLPRLYKEIVSSKTLSSIAISGSMTKTSYTTADNWNPAGLTVTGTYSDSSTQNLTASATFTYFSDSALENPKATPSALGIGNDQTIYIKATVSDKTASKSQNVSVNPVTYSVTYDANGGTGEMIDSSSPYSASSTVTILNNSFSRNGYTFVCFNTQADGFGTDYNPDETFTISSNIVLYAKWKYPYTDADSKITWDLSKTSYDSMGASAATWFSTKASISVEKATSSTATNNACPPNYEHTRFYQNSVMTISPASGYKITSIIFTATSNDYATKVKNSTWTNATKTSSSTTATIVPEVKINPVSVTFSNAVYITKIVVNYAVYSALDHISLSGTYPTAFNQGDAFSHEGMVVTATYENGSTANVTSSATWSGYNMSGSGNQTVTVSYIEELVEKTATYAITVTAAPFIAPDQNSASGQVGENDILTFTYGHLNSSLNIVSSAASIVTVGVPDIVDEDEGMVQIIFVGSGTTTVLFKDGETQLASVPVTVTRTTKLTSKQLLSANLTTTMNCTAGFDIVKNEKSTKESGYYKDGGTADSEINYFMVGKASALFSSEPASIKFTARMRGGSGKDPLGYNVEACFVDNEGSEITETKRTVTTKLTTTQTNYTISLPYSASACGVKLMHLKESGFNVYYYSFELSCDYGSSVKTLTANEVKDGNGTTTSVNNVTLRFGAKFSTDNWTAFNSEHTITDYGVMFARKTYLDSHSVSSVKAAYETNESLLYVVRRGSGTAPSLSEGNRVFTAYLTLDPSDYNTVFCATPFIVAGGQYYFLEEMRYSVKTLAAECQTTHASPLSDEALAILNA